MAAPRPSAKPLDLDLTIVSAKHLKNVNWRQGDLKPYVIFWVDQDRRLATKSDDAGSTRPVWNERFLVPLSLPLPDSILTVEIFHSKPSETPKPLVGTLRFPLKDLIGPDDSNRLRTFELRRPSGRPHGKIRLKLAVRERPLPDYHVAPQPSYYYNSAPPPSTRDYRVYPPSQYTASVQPPPPPQPAPAVSPPPIVVHSPHSYSYGGYSDNQPGYYSGGHYPQHPPPPQPKPAIDRQFSYGGGPSAPLDYTPYDQRAKGGRMGAGPGLAAGAVAGLAAGAVAGALGGLTLEEGVHYEEDKIADRAEDDLAARDDYSNYRTY